MRHFGWYLTGICTLDLIWLMFADFEPWQLGFWVFVYVILPVGILLIAGITFLVARNKEAKKKRKP
jgi:hypothetical protein